MKKKLTQNEIAASQYTLTTTGSSADEISGTPLHSTSGPAWSQRWSVPSTQELTYQIMKADILEEVLTELKKGLISKDNK